MIRIMSEKLYDEIDEKLNAYDEDSVIEKPRKKFCVWLFAISLFGGLIAMFLVKIPALIVCAIVIILTENG